ncbi:hypothetical protein EV363DRAFT_890877 [Boletus edulis]|uniref:Uncharacterized protein n=1 Tax=Boletus edulis BED1 TaxID=1328754 RepID=A0AAD4C0L3_BOLED|nr:hypothetical protein EV363DRAFT_890877 [Boletus edulis]KAF8444919.1 hypothetical protein L210DRAFT_3502334 [Boletus edulis BED1]
MTEYDYSPAAYERYIAQQTRVSNWVNDTVQQAHSYSNPFVLSPTLRDRTFYNHPEEDDNPPRHQDQWSMGSSRPSRSRSRSYVDHAQYDRAAPSRHRTQSHLRSSSTPRDIFYKPHGSQHHNHPQPHVSQPRIQTSPPRNYHYGPPAHSPTRQAYVTQPPQGQIYHNEPAPVPKDTLYQHASHSRHSSSKPPPQPYLLVQGGGPKAEYKRGPPIHAPIPTKPHAAQQPLLKRLFGFVANSPVSGRSGNGRGFRGSSY